MLEALSTSGLVSAWVKAKMVCSNTAEKRQQEPPCDSSTKSKSKLIKTLFISVIYHAVKNEGWLRVILAEVIFIEMAKDHLAADT